MAPIIQRLSHLDWWDGEGGAATKRWFRGSLSHRRGPEGLLGCFQEPLESWTLSRFLHLLLPLDARPTLKVPFPVWFLLLYLDFLTWNQLPFPRRRRRSPRLVCFSFHRRRAEFRSQVNSGGVIRATGRIRNPEGSGSTGDSPVTAVTSQVM